MYNITKDFRPRNTCKNCGSTKNKLWAQETKKHLNYHFPILIFCKHNCSRSCGLGQVRRTNLESQRIRSMYLRLSDVGWEHLTENSHAEWRMVQLTRMYQTETLNLASHACNLPKVCLRQTTIRSFLQWVGSVFGQQLTLSWLNGNDPVQTGRYKPAR